MALSSGRTIVGEFKLSIVVVGTSGGIRDRVCDGGVNRI